MSRDLVLDVDRGTAIDQDEDRIPEICPEPGRALLRYRSPHLRRGLRHQHGRCHGPGRNQ